jgi:hypothetical protein
MKLQDTSTFLINFKGAALSTFILMWTMRKKQRNWTRNNLADLTGWNRESVAQGLRRLLLHGYVARLNYETWQLTDLGSQLDFDDLKILNEPLRVDIIDSHNSSSLKNHDHEYVLNHDKEPLQPRVDNIDSHVVRETTNEALFHELISYGSTPAKAHEAISQALATEPNKNKIRLRILWWRVYCAAHKSIGFPGNLIAARVAAGIDTPKDFSVRDIPDRFYELGQEIEDLQREIDMAMSVGQQ